MRIIDADALKKCAIPCEIHNGALTDLCVPLYQIDNAPTVELQMGRMTNGIIIPIERPTGEWINHYDDLFPAESTEECSICHEEQTIGNDDNYCPHCGARMKGAEE